MSTGVVRAPICSFLTDSDHLQHVDRSKMAKEQARQFLQAITENNSCLSVFDTFASSPLKVLEKCLYSPISTEVSCRSKSVKREKLWTAFQLIGFCDLDKMWRDLFGHAGIPPLTPLVYQ